METFAVYFRPRAPLATWPLSSDLLAGAVCWGMRLLGLMDEAGLSGWLAGQQEQPRFAFSQALPAWLGNGAPIRFYPRPLSFHPRPADVEAYLARRSGGANPTTKNLRAELARKSKQIKSIGYVSETALSALQQGRLTPDQLLRLEQPDAEWVKVDNLLCSRADAKILSKSLSSRRMHLLERTAVQHNSVDRVGGATVEGALFYKEEVFFAPGAALWAVLRADSGDVKSLIAPALRLLADTGYGADRSTGRGFFDIQIEPLEIEQFHQKRPAVMTLSRYLPCEGELNLNGEPLAYRLVTVHPKREQRFGYGLESDSRPLIYKRAVRMFEPGSVFPRLVEEKDIFGRWVLLSSPDSPPIYQSGAAVMLPL